MNMGEEGYAGVPYNLRKRGHYANGHLDQLAGGSGTTPVYVAYLWYFGEFVRGEPQYKIFMGRGQYTNGVFTAFNVNGREFTESDYNTPCKYSNEGDHFFAEVTGDVFGRTLSSCKVAYATGGIPYLPIM